MSTEPMEMEQDIVTGLAEEKNESSELARQAAEQANGELETAHTILDGMIPKYLVVKARFISLRSDAGGGLVFMVCKKGSDNFEILRTIFDNDLDWVKSVSLERTPEKFLQLIKDYFEVHASSLRFYDAQKLRDGLAAKLSMAGIQYLFELWNVSEPGPEDIEDPTETFQHPLGIIESLFSEALGDVLVNRVHVDIDYEFYNETEFGQVGQALGLFVNDASKSSGSEFSELFGEITVTFKGQFAIDPVEGVVAKALELGDKVYVEILDRSEIAVAVAKYMGAYASGSWVAVKATIVKISKGAGERLKFKLHLINNIYINVLSYHEIKIRCAESLGKKQQEIMEEISNKPNVGFIVVGILLLAMLVIFFTLFLR